METIIKKSIEGGYKYSCIPRPFSPLGDGMTCHFVGVNSQWTVWTRDDNGSSIFIGHEEVILDPLFWKALHTSCGWRTGANNHWIKKALKFHEINLTESWDKAVSYLSNLINQNHE